MLAVIHALIGGLIGEEFHSILLIIIASFVMHFIIDMIPHWDGNFDRKKFIKSGEANKPNKWVTTYYVMDIIFTVVLVIGLYRIFHNKLLVLGSFIGVLPDFLSLGYQTKLRKNKKYMKFLQFHSKIQRDTDWKKSLFIHLALIIVLMIIFLVIYY